MEKENIAVGLDIGTTKIVAMIGKKNEYGKLEILGLGKAKSLGVKRGVVNNITQTIQSIQHAVADAETQAGYKIKNVVVGIAGQHIRSIQHSDYISRPNPDEVIGDKDIEQLINQVQKLSMLPGEEIIHVLPQEFKIDGEPGIKEPVGMYGSRLEATFHVVVGQAALIKNAGRCIKDAGLELAGITLEPLASAEAVLSQEEKEAGVALIDIGGGTTDLAIFKDGIIRHTAVVPFGGNVITEDIKEGCSIIERQAEILKVKFGSAWPGENKDNEIVSIPGLRGKEPKEISLKNLSKIINARVEEIIQLVFSEIKSYGYENPQKKLIAGIVLTGGGSELKHIKQLVEYITGIDTRIGYPNEHLAGDSSLEVSSPLYATGVGLVMESEKHRKRGAVSVEELKAVETKVESKPEERKVVYPSPVEEEVVNTQKEPVERVIQPRVETISQPKEEQKEGQPSTSTADRFESSFIGNFFRKIKEFIEKQE
ncbi:MULTISPECIES: cell division protein FtsA [Myroides]|jgi:cell division protein FtsA|uniref:Cell division protein FtsA n=1 Tax=Myroides odoratus TaxID=256 RepID=A0A9Q7E8E0_MYROD|nr:cell division protein FtsA [Myroides odoratus]EHQ42187.1 cell division protein FtsA [Myroides odoratus DSM 2801]EKB09319.1 cell division protein FtsA [Myroides odoratus CIP 103059]MDR0224321.1 cell division protein FtsA [Myroides odoratus]QQT99567.1 cell division protein FtsA [Myroides odoratus]WQD58225.1 cell division protein FtsA [Myroides odoratus]